MESHPSNFPTEFICPISRSVMADPVIVSSGQTYERRCIEAWMDLGQSWCVKQSIPLDRNLMISNTGLKAAITNMVKSKGMRTLPSPPSPELAFALARRLIQELTQPNAGAQEPWCSDSEGEDEFGFDEEKDAPVRQILVENLINEEEVEEEHVEDGRMESATVADERRRKMSSSFHPADAHIEASAIADERRRSNLKSSSSLHPADADMESLAISDERRRNYLKSSSSLPPLNAHVEVLARADEMRGNYLKSSSGLHPANANHGGVTRAAVNPDDRSSEGLDLSRAVSECSRGGPSDAYFEGFGRSRAAGQRSGGGPSDGHGRYSNLVRYSHSSSGETLLEASRGLHELPPHLATKPSSYSSSEGPHSSSPLSSSSTADPLVKRLKSEKREEQEAAVADLRQLTRAPENRLPLCHIEIIQALLPLFKSKNPNIQVNAVAALVNLSLEKPNKITIVRAGAVRFLIDVLNNGVPEAQEHAAGAAFSLAIADENKHSMGVLNVIPPLIQLVNAGPPGSRQDAAMALYHLSLLQANKTKLVKHGAVPILLNLAQSRDRPDMASRSLVILSNVASIPEGKAMLLQLNAITILVKLLAIQGNRSAAAIPEQAAAVLVLLAMGNLRFKSVALNAGAQELLTALCENGTIRAREKALALLAIMKESSSGPDELDADSVLSRQYRRMRVDGGSANSSAF
eukprot:c22624_g1_i1 orf=941-3013(+)